MYIFSERKLNGLHDETITLQFCQFSNDLEIDLLWPSTILYYLFSTYRSIICFFLSKIENTLHYDVAHSITFQKMYSFVMFHWEFIEWELDSWTNVGSECLTVFRSHFKVPYMLYKKLQSDFCCCIVENGSCDVSK